MVEALPDVPYPFASIVDELHEAAGPRQLKALARGVRTENRGARGARVFEAQQALVLRIEIEKQVVTELERRARLRALRLETHYGISAVAVQIDQVFRCVQRTRRTVKVRIKAGKRIGRDVSVPAAHLAPGNLAIAVAVEPDGEIEVAQRNVPLAVQFVALDRYR